MKQDFETSNLYLNAVCIFLCVFRNTNRVFKRRSTAHRQRPRLVRARKRIRPQFRGIPSGKLEPREIDFYYGSNISLPTLLIRVLNLPTNVSTAEHRLSRVTSTPRINNWSVYTRVRHSSRFYCLPRKQFSTSPRSREVNSIGRSRS